MASQADVDSQPSVQTITLTGEDGTTQVYTMDSSSQLMADLSDVGNVAGQEVLVENDGNIFYLIQSEGDAVQGVSYVVIDENGKPTEQAEAVDLGTVITADPTAAGGDDYNGTIQVEIQPAETGLDIQVESAETPAEEAQVIMVKSNDTDNVDLDLSNIVNCSTESTTESDPEGGYSGVAGIEEEEGEDVKYLLCCHCCGEALETVEELKKHLLEFHGVSDDAECSEDEIVVNSTVLAASDQGKSFNSVNCSESSFKDDSEQLTELKSVTHDKRKSLKKGNDVSEQLTEIKSEVVMRMPTSTKGGSIEHKCQFCVQSFDVRSDLDLHIEIDHEVLDDLLELQSDTRFYSKCPYCPRLYLSKWSSKSLRRHIRMDHPGHHDDYDGYEIIEVNDKSQLRKLKNDVIMSNTEEKYACPLCPKVFHWQKSLARHAKTFHTDQIKDLTEDQHRLIFGSGRKRKTLDTACEDEMVVVHTCPYCFKDFLWQKSVKKHVGDNHPDQYQEFIENEKIFSPTLRNHNKSSNDKDTNSLVYFKCLYCNLVSKYAHSIRNHLVKKHSDKMTDVDVKELELPTVDATSGLYKVKSADSRTKQVRLSECDVVYGCPKCKYQTDNQSNLQRHLTSRVHNYAYSVTELQGSAMSKFRVNKQGRAHKKGKETEETPTEKTNDETIPVEDDTEDQTESDAMEIEPDNVESDPTPTVDQTGTHSNKANTLECKLTDIPELCKIHVNLKVSFNCTKCSQTFFHFEKLQEHYHESHDEEFNATKDDVMAVELIKKTIRNLKAMECPYCDLIVSQAPVLEQHICVNHETWVNQLNIKQEPLDVETDSMYKADGTVDDTVKRSVVTAYRCMTCVCEFAEVLGLIKHMSVVHSENGKSTKQSGKKRGRKRKNQEAGSKTPTLPSRASVGMPEYDNKCPHCQFSCKRASALTFHINFNHAHIKQEPQDEEETPRKRAKLNHSSNQAIEIGNDLNVQSATDLDETTKNKSKRGRKPLADKIKDTENTSVVNDKDPFKSNTDQQPISNDTVENVNMGLALIQEEANKDNDNDKQMGNEVEAVIKKENLIDVTPVKTKARGRKKKKRGRRKSTVTKVDNYKNDMDIAIDEADEEMELGLDDDLDTDYQPAVEETLIKPETPAIMRHKCPYCDSGFLSLRFLEKHVKRSHPEQFMSFSLDDVKLTETESTLKTDNHKCTYCKKLFPSLKSVHEHMNTFHKVKQEPVDDWNEDIDGHQETVTKNTIQGFRSKKYTTKQKKKKNVITDWSSLVMRKNPGFVISSENEICYKCKYCNVFLASQASVIRHAAVMHPNERKIDPDEIEMIKNETDSNLENCYYCPYCNKTSPWKKCIVRHVKNMHPFVTDFNADDIQIEIGVSKGLYKLPEIGRFKCPYCNAVHKWKKSIIKHIRSVHPNQKCDIYLLSICMGLDDKACFSFESMQDIKNKKRTVHCSKCNFTSGMVKKVQRHYQLKHPEDYDSSLDIYFHYTYEKEKNLLTDNMESDYDEVHECVLCGTSYRWRKSLLYHMKTNHPDKLEMYETLNGIVEIVDRTLAVQKNTHHKTAVKGKSCTICGITCRSQMAKNSHMRLKHQSRYTKSTQLFSCGVCRLSFSSRLALTKHRAIHHLGARKSVPCGLCGKVCSSRRTHVLHEQICQGTRSEVCPRDNCDYKCVLRSSLKNHQQVYHPLQQPELTSSREPPLSERCELCWLSFPDGVGLKDHIVQAHYSRTWYLTGIPRKKPRYTCSTCHKTFSKPSLRNLHIATKHKDKANMCEICGQIYPTLVQLRRHYAKHSQDKGIQQDVCNLCGTTMLKANLYKHYLYKHPESCVCECDICVNQTSDRQRTVQCDICGQKFCRKMILYAHKKVEHDIDKNSKYRCKFCSQLFTTNKARFKHIHKHHGRGATRPPPVATPSVDVTPTITTTQEGGDGDEKENSATHVIHIGEGQGVQYLPRLSEASLSAVIKELMIVSSDKLSKLPYKCLLCGRSFAKTKYIRLHIRRNHVKDEDQPYRCKICGSGFVRLTEFRKHSRAHSGFRPYKCKVCGRAFKQQANLTDHMKIHKGVKEYQCYICNRQYRQRGALTAHINHHDTLKPFKCMYCDKGFTTRGELSRHMQKYDDLEEKGYNGRSFLCHICRSSFTHFPLLLKHIEERHPEKPFHCQVCGQYFAAYSSLYNHKLRAKHFLETELESSETSTVRKIRKNNRKSAADIQEAVYTIHEGGVDMVQPIESDNLQQIEGGSTSKRQLTSDDPGSEIVCFVGDQGEVAETVYITQQAEFLETHGDSDKRLEVVIEQFHPEEVVPGTQITNENEELLSIAKQLTELSTIAEAEANEAENATILQEEDEIMKDMLDADQELLDNLGKHLGARRDEGSDHWSADTTRVEVYPHISTRQTTHSEITQSVDDLGVSVGDQEVETTAMEVADDKQTVIKASPTKTIPTNMEELASLIAQNSQIPLEGESVTAYQTEDGSVIYVLDQPNTLEGETYELTTTKDYTEMETGNTNQETDEMTVTEQTEVMQEDRTILHEDGTIISETGTVIQSDGTVLQEDGTVLHDDDGVLHDSGSHVLQVGRTMIQEDGTIVQEVLHDPVTILPGEDEDTVDNVETVEAAAAAVARDTMVVTDKDKLESGDIGPPYNHTASSHVSEMTQCDDMVIHSEAFIETGQKVVEYIHDEQTFIKEELIATDYSKIVDEMTNVIAESKALRYEINDNEFRCLKCNYICVNHKNMKKHLRRHTPVGHREFDCTVCDKRFITNCELVRHMHTHTGEKNHECRYCSKRFRQAGHLKDHIKVHLGQRDYKCSDCEATFTTKNQCVSHWHRKHSDVRAYCDECGKSFSDKQGLIKHKGSIHSGVFAKPSKPKSSTQRQPGNFHCHICGAGYQRKLSLENHMETHKTDKNNALYMCEVCGCAFKSMPSLNEHILVEHSEEKPEICEYCGSTFKLKKHLQRHIKIEHQPADQKPKKIFYCGCGKKFATKNSMAYHIGRNAACRVSKVTVYEDKVAEATVAVTSITAGTDENLQSTL